MIKYKYKLQRNMGNKIEIYTPNQIPTEMENLTYIEGPNSIGKSTILNIIALAFYGLKKANLYPSLKDKIDQLLNASDQKLTYKIEVTNRYLGEQLIAKKKDPDQKEIEIQRITKLGSKPERLSADRFLLEYNLIYDIPVNPLDRFHDLTAEIKSRQQDYGIRVSSIRNLIHQYIQQIERGKNPKALESAYKQLDSQSEKAIKNQESINYTSQFLKDLKIYTYIKLYNEYSDRIERLKKEKQILDHSRKSIKSISSRIEKRIETLTNVIIENKKNLKSDHISSISLLKRIIHNEKGRIEIWSCLNIDDEIKQQSDKIITHALYFKNKITGLLHENENTETYQQVNLLKDLLGILRHYIDSSFIIPGIDKSVPEFVNILEDLSKDYDDLNQKISDMKNCLTLLDNIKSVMTKLLNELIPEAIKISNEYQQKTGEALDISDDASYNEIISNISEYEKCQKSYKNKLIKNDIDEANHGIVFKELEKKPEISIFKDHSEHELLESISCNQSELSKLESKSRDINTSLRMIENEIQRIENAKPHKYQNYKEELEKYFTICLSLEKKLTKEYNLYISNLIEKKVNLDQIDQAAEKYYEKVSEYLAQILKKVRHIDKDYDIEKLDIIHRAFITKDGEILKLDYFGTGQSQSAYLKGLLSGTDNRKLIVLLDEISNMDEKSLSPIYKKLKELYKSGKLLLAILVQKGEKLKIKPLVQD